MPVSYELGQRIVDAYRDVDDFMRRRGGEGGPELIDIDVAPPRQDGFTIYDYPQAKKTLNYLSRQLDPEDPEGRYMQARLRSTVAYLGYVANAGRDEPDFNNMIRRTLGFRPFRFPDEAIEHTHKLLDGLLAHHGEQYGAKLRYEPGYFDAYHQVFDIPKYKLAASAEHSARSMLGLASKTLTLPRGTKRPKLGQDISTKAVAENKPWVGYMTTEGPDNTLTSTFNMHPIHRHTPFGQDVINFHEAAHLIQFGLAKQEIAAGRMNPFHGLTTFHGPEILQAEFNAQAAEHLLADTKNTWQHYFQAILNDHTTMVWNNVHIDLNSGKAPQSVTRYLRRELPLHTQQNISRQVKERRNNLNAKLYYISYSPGLRMVLGYFQHLPYKRRARELGHAMLAHRTHDEMEEYYGSLVKSGGKRAALV